MACPSCDITILLGKVRGGDRTAEEQLLQVVYRELRQIAARCMRTERAGHTLQPSALVNEAYLRLSGNRVTEWQDRKHFFAAAGVMRRILIDYARARNTGKRGGDQVGSTPTTSLLPGASLPNSCSASTKPSNGWLSSIRARAKSWSFGFSQG